MSIGAIDLDERFRAGVVLSDLLIIGIDQRRRTGKHPLCSRLVLRSGKNRSIRCARCASLMPVSSSEPVAWRKGNGSSDGIVNVAVDLRLLSTGIQQGCRGRHSRAKVNSPPSQNLGTTNKNF